MTHILRQAACAVCAGMIMLALTALPAHAIDINNLPDWVRDSIHPVEIDWSQVYPGFVAPPAWAQDPAAVQEVHPGAGTPQAAGIGTLSTVSPAGPAGALNVAHPVTAATGGLQTASPASGLGGIGGLAPAHPSAAATAGLHEVRPTPAAMTGLHEVKPGSSATAGLEPVSAGPIVGQINRLAPTDTRAQQLLLTWSAQLRDGTLDREGVKQIIAEQNVPSDTLIGVLNGLPLAHPMDPVYLPVCETLWQRSGEKLDTCLALPYAPRIYMATYLGTIAREEDAKTLLSSLSNPDKMTLGADLYHVANELSAYRRCAYRLAIWCHKSGASLRGPADEAFVCMHISQSCLRLGEPGVVCDELMPWAEEALRTSESGTRWPYALRALMWAHDFLGDTSRAVEIGEACLNAATAGRMRACSLYAPMRTLARLYVKQDRHSDAVEMLQSAIGEVGQETIWAQEAQAELLRLAANWPDVDPVRVLPGRLSKYGPTEMEMTAHVGAALSRSVAFFGNPSFLILTAECSLPSAQVRISAPRIVETRCEQRVDVTLTQPRARGNLPGKLLITTNDPANGVVVIPVRVTGTSSLQPDRASVFFGFVKAGDRVTRTVSISGVPEQDALDFTIDRPDLLHAAAKQTADAKRLLEFSLVCDEREPAGVIEGAIVLSVRSTGANARLPYYAHVLQVAADD